MHRFYLPPDRCSSETLVLIGNEAHHALHVLRTQRGDEVLVLNGAGDQFTCEVHRTGRAELELTVVKKQSFPPPPARITLLQAIPRGKIIESIIQKATELGSARIVPLLTDRVATRLDAAPAADKAEKWQAVAIEATKQCGAAWLPKVETPMTPEQFLSRGETFDLSLIASLQPGSRHAREYFAAYQNEKNTLPRTVSIWVGPEGDFTPAEIVAAEAAGARPISLGPLVLRSETAAIYCLSILNHELSV